MLIDLQLIRNIGKYENYPGIPAIVGQEGNSTMFLFFLIKRRNPSK